MKNIKIEQTKIQEAIKILESFCNDYAIGREDIQSVVSALILLK